jgi:hypothetical protein
MATGMTTSILLTWEQPEGSVDRYILDYEFSINECSGSEGTFPPVRTTIEDGSLRMYTIENSTGTPMEEDSLYSITLRAINAVDTSEPSDSATVNTTIAGGYYSLCAYHVLRLNNKLCVYSDTGNTKLYIQLLGHHHL